MKRVVIVIAMLALGAAGALAQSCPSHHEVLDNGGKAWLGINAGGFVAGEGQTVHLECGGVLQTVKFLLVLDGQTYNSAPPLRTGNILIASVRMPGIGVTLGTATAVIGFDLGTEWVSFDFTAQGIDLAAGDYLITCAPAGTGQGRLAYWQGEDHYAGGLRYLSEGGNAGPWVAIGSEFGDLAFQLDLDVPTPAEEMSWSGVKSLYR